MTDPTTTATATATEPVITSTPEAAKPEADRQAEINAIAANVRKEATASARKALLKELGIEDADDPKAVEAIKGKLTAAQEAEKAKMSAEEKALARIAELEKERDEAKATATAANTKRIETAVNSQLSELASKAGALHPADVIDYLRTKQADKVAGLLKDDESIDPKAAGELIAEVKKARDNWFQTARGAGSPSMSGGATPGIDDKAARERASRRNQQIIRG